MITAGIDVGSISTKAAVMKNGLLIGDKVIPTGYNAANAGRQVFQELLAVLRLTPSDVTSVVATGYGRNRVEFADRTVTEITCHAAGARYLSPRLRFIIDIGGQDSKAIALDDGGQVKDFAMNDKCSAGTGRFLEVMARTLEADLDSFGDLSQKRDRPSPISSVCTVFAETEVVSLIARGEKRENIIAGIHEAIAGRVIAMAGRLGVSPPAMMTGGVSKNIGVVRALEKRLGFQVEVSGKAQVTGAIGGALLASW
jgi:predicted CoA-substrate-specific enzyme activase